MAKDTNATIDHEGTNNPLASFVVAPLEGFHPRCLVMRLISLATISSTRDGR